MYLPDFELHEAGSLDEASELLGRHAPDARLLAGGTDLLVDLRTARYRVGHVISLKGVPELRGVAEDDDGLGIGAMTSITGLAASAAVRERWPAILDAALRMASHQIRNRATVGGNIGCAAPCADLPPILIVMNASIVLRRSAGGERTLPLDAFFTGPRETVITPDEILTAVCVPEPAARSGSAYARFSLREGNAIPVAGVAAGLRLNDDGTIGVARIAMGAVAPTPRLVPAAAELLEGVDPSDEAFAGAAERAMEAAEPISDVRGTADYRRTLVGVLTRRALVRALERASGGRSGGDEASSSHGRAAGDGASRDATPGGTAS